MATRVQTSRRRHGAWLLVVLAAIAVGLWAWNSNPIQLKNRFFARHLATVYPGWLYRSGQISAGLIEPTLRDLGIDVIVDLTHQRAKGDADQDAERKAADALGIERHVFPLGGSGTGRVEEYVGAVAEIARAERAGKQVLVHCRAGDRRSAGVVAVYSMLVRGEPISRAELELGRFNRQWRDSNLVAFLDENLPAIARGLVERGVIPQVPNPLPRLPQADGVASRDSKAPETSEERM